jgi:hypothetical protein
LAPPAALTLVACIVACTVACSDGGAAEGVFTQSTCPPADPPTYATFAQAFMQTYCIACHDSAKTGADRMDAPPTIDFDSLALLRMWTSQIDKQAAIGPAAMNRLMPPSGSPAPSDAERRRLGEFVACEVTR